MAKKKYICAGCNKCTEPCTVELSGDADMTKDPAKMLHCGTWVEVPAEENTNKEQLPKLTTEVFSMEECPEWAQYAAVDASGKAYWYDEKPMLLSGEWAGTGTHFARQIMRVNSEAIYNSFDWQSSLIERPVAKRLPKLTVDVFSFRDCPEWAQYAAVDAEGIAYWYDTKPKLGSQAWCNASEHFVARQITLENIPIRYDRANWRNSLIERPVEQRLPRLTVDVFCREECPEWAEYAAVDADGDAYWYAGKPRPLGAAWYQGGGYRASQIGPRYDASDWKNSLVEHPDVHRQELTHAVFEQDDTPIWARYAAVNADGMAFWFDKKPQEPEASDNIWIPKDCSSYNCIPGVFVARNWRGSCIRRTNIKLTEKIFNHPECPDDAVVAVVNADGTATWGTCADIELCGGGFRTKEPTLCCWTRIPGDACFDATDWEHSAVYKAGVQPKSPEPEVPKLTHDVFSYSTLNEWKYVMSRFEDRYKTYTGCPEWTRYAAVDKNGTLCVYENKPIPLHTTWINDGGRYARVCDADEHELQFDGTDWMHSLIERPAVAPKLTQDVFSATDCPEWARYAAVDENGSAYWYEMQPQLRLGSSVWFSSGLRSQMMYLPNRFAAIIFDSTDWMHSLIERPAVVPDWFKPGALACNVYTHTCFHVTDSTEYCENYLEAKVRPFNDDELERKLGQCVLGPKNSRLLVTGFRPKGDISGKPEICVLCGWLTAEELLTYGSRPQGINQYHSKEGTWIDCGPSN